MSIEITLHPRKSSREGLRKFLIDLGFRKTRHLWDWPKGSVHFHWFDDIDFRSFDGVEATVFPSNDSLSNDHEKVAWELHTRTRASASPSDRTQQNHVIRSARKQFGGTFENDCYGRNRYTPVQPDVRDAPSRGIHLAYEEVSESVRAVKFAIPDPIASLEKLVGTKLEAVSIIDPTRILYNALVPFALAVVESFFKKCFVILLQYDDDAQKKLEEENKKVDISDVIQVQAGTKRIEEIVARWYSFQNINSIHKAFNEWFGIDFWRLLRQRKAIGRRCPRMDDAMHRLIADRHDVIHRLRLNRELRKEGIEEILDFVMVVIDIFADHLEGDRGMIIRD